MYIPRITTFAVLLPLLLLSHTVIADINCDGSHFCKKFPSQASLSNFQRMLPRNQTSRRYYNGDHIACFSGKGGRGLCLFLHYMPKNGSTNLNPSLAASQIPPLLDALIAYGCKHCGSVPINELYGGPHNNSDDNGILTSNYVRHTDGCQGFCQKTGGK